MFTQHVKGKGKTKDEYYTPKWVFEMLAPFLPKDKIIWEAFGTVDQTHIQSAEYLRELGFKVVQTKNDFFLENKGDVIVSNPPFSKLKDIFIRLKELKKPFCLLVNNCVLHSNYFRAVFGGEEENINLQILYPPKINYDIIDDVEKGTLKVTTKCPFYSVFICYQMFLPTQGVTFMKK